ncbi:hypothetical protein JHK85_011476 [Glycine max]|uniref:Uncharacterized protein n=1 Tax=Glycine soja TaxID=3848 RepID=A0A0B2SBU0_GLYSO|nr:hypothetical protein JHK85_011476 [Glycine max]KHN44221.1 hypothetical protein glysoja_024441 [Glycine soja]
MLVFKTNLNIQSSSKIYGLLLLFCDRGKRATSHWFAVADLMLGISTSVRIQAEIRVPNQYALHQSELLQAQSINPTHSPSIGVGQNSKRKQYYRAVALDLS